MTDLIERVAAQLLADYDSEYDASHLTWRDFEQQARRVLVVVADFLGERAALIPPPGDGEPFATGFATAIEVIRDA